MKKKLQKFESFKDGARKPVNEAYDPNMDTSKDLRVLNGFTTKDFIDACSIVVMQDMTRSFKIQFMTDWNDHQDKSQDGWEEFFYGLFENLPPSGIGPTETYAIIQAFVNDTLALAFSDDTYFDAEFNKPVRYMYGYNDGNMTRMAFTSTELDIR